MKNILLSASLLAATLGCASVFAADAPASAKEAQVAPAKPIRVLAFSATHNYRHGGQIAASYAMLRDFAKAGDIVLDTHSGEKAEVFTDEVLKNVDVIVFLHTTETLEKPLLNKEQRAAFEAFIKRGGGWVGIHGASDMGYDWPFFTEMLGAHFLCHPPEQTADMHVVNGEHPATRHLPDVFRHYEEIYNFDANIHGKPGFTELITVDEKTYNPAGHYKAVDGKDTPFKGMGANHPLAWTHDYAGGRCFYTELGHTGRSYSRPWFRQHVLGGIQWAAGRDK